MKFPNAEFCRFGAIVVPLTVSAHLMAQQATVVPPPMQFDSANPVSPFG